MAETLARRLWREASERAGRDPDRLTDDELRRLRPLIAEALQRRQAAA